MNFDFDAGFAEMVLLARFEPGPHPYQAIFDVFYNNFRFFCSFYFESHRFQNFRKALSPLFPPLSVVELWSSRDLCRRCLHKSHRRNTAENICHSV